MPSKITTQSQKRAEFAFEQVNSAKEALNDTASEFKAHVKKVPLMIRTNGLAAAYAFVQSKAKYKTENGDGKKEEVPKNDYAWITQISREWLKGKALLADQIPEDSNKKKDQQFAGDLAALNREQYRQARKELLSLFTWLKRFAEGLIKKEKEVENV